jgi:hypothetical protein
VALSAILIAGIAFVALVRQPHPQMRAFLVAMAVLVAAASRFRNWLPRIHWRTARPIAAFVLGIGFYLVFFLGAILLATVRVPAAWFLVAVAALLLEFGWLCHQYEFDRLPDAASVALGSYFAASLFNFAGGIAHRSIEVMAVAGLLTCAFAWFAWKNSKSGAVRT